MCALLSLCALRAEGHTPERVDTTRIYEVELIEVVTTVANQSTPVAQSSLAEEDILNHSYGTDLPTALALTPSLVATNETGIGIGATSIRLRGTDATRINEIGRAHV